MPQMGIEYQLEPTEEQKQLYHKMIDWELILSSVDILTLLNQLRQLKRRDKKLIIYSMGNFLSNQRIETMQDMRKMQNGQNVVF